MTVGVTDSLRCRVDLESDTESLKRNDAQKATYQRDQSIKELQANERLITTLEGPKKRKDFAAQVDLVLEHDRRPIMTFFGLLNLKPNSKKGRMLDEHQVLQFIVDYPDFCSDVFRFEAFHKDLIHPFHMLCALGAKPALLKACFKSCEAALFHDESNIGSPIHYAVNCRSSFETIRWLVKKDIDSLQIQNSKGQTPLHLAILSKAKTEAVAFLTDRCGAAALQVDNNGMTPLHLACTVENPVLEVIEDLTEVCPEAGEILSKDGVETPLLIAIRRRATTAILKDLIISHPKVASIPDIKGLLPLHRALENEAAFEVIRDLIRAHPEGVRTWDNKESKNLPVHTAVRIGCTAFDVYKLLARKYPEGLEMENTAGHTPHSYAAFKGLDTNIVEFLNPFEETDE